MESKELLHRIDEWDQKVISKYNGIGGKFITYCFKIVSFLGRETIWLILMVYYLFIWYDPYLLAHICITFLIGVVLIAPIKKLFKRSRPFETLENLNVFEREPTSRSFPSWHVYNITSQGLLFGYIFNSLIFTVLFLILSIIVGFSRIQLGVHYPSDVIAGFFIGIIGFFLSVFLFSPLFLELIMFFEQLINYEIQYYQINSRLLEKIWYLILCIGIFSLILLISSHKMLKDLYKKIKKVSA
ncbi:MAG: phosphatase PAP2 family protein [Promethearchaeota archaeon]|jgi:undecaprenyl-diphosphatase